MTTLEKEAGSIILVKDSKQENTYHVRESTHNNDPWDEGTMFYVSPREVDDHYFVMQDHRKENEGEVQEIVGVAHNKEELKGRIHECAVKYCEMIARQRGKSFIDKTDFDVPLELPIPDYPEDYREGVSNEEGYTLDPEEGLF